MLAADPGRVLARIFLPGQENVSTGRSRADAVLQRIVALDPIEADRTLTRTVSRFADRHSRLPAIFAEHFDQIAAQVRLPERLSSAQRALIGAYFTQEYAFEAAAFFNPSIVAHPDQTKLDDGQLRFVLSARAVGEGHISSIEFRSGVLTGHDGVRMDSVGVDPTSGRLTALTDSDYRLAFEPGSVLSDRVLFPRLAQESHGMEDARFTRYLGPNGVATYLSTYTAYDGQTVSPRVLCTDDFVSFESRRQLGAAALNKGMAIFPRQIGGRFHALSRSDRESIGLAVSDDLVHWQPSSMLQTPNRSWQLIQLGNCGSPLETDAGWLVFTHGVGPMREYSIGAILLDRDDPGLVLGSLSMPLLVPGPDEREGYVPNVVYSCGGLIHGPTVVLPYGCSDARIRFAFISLAEILSNLTDPGAAPAEPA